MYVGFWPPPLERRAHGNAAPNGLRRGSSVANGVVGPTRRRSARASGSTWGRRARSALAARGRTGHCVRGFIRQPRGSLPADASPRTCERGWIRLGIQQPSAIQGRSIDSQSDVRIIRYAGLTCIPVIRRITSDSAVQLGPSSVESSPMRVDPLSASSNNSLRGQHRLRETQYSRPTRASTTGAAFA